MKSLRTLFLALGFLSLAAAAQAQIAVEISIKQRFYLLHEPVIATALLTNQTGRDITLSDTEQYQWFGFRITAPGDQIVPPRNLHYKVPPITLKAGEVVKRSINLTELYELDDFGTYRVQATIYFDGLDKFFASRPTYIEETDGHVIWRKAAGVPEGQPGAGQTRIFSLLAHQRGEINTLYVRVTDQDDGMVYCTYPIGRLLDGVPVQAEFDSSNNLYVLQLNGTRSYVLTKVSPDGKFGGQTNYSAPTTRPTLRKTAEGALQIIGGHREIASNQPTAPLEIPKLSARPAGLPTAEH